MIKESINELNSLLKEFCTEKNIIFINAFEHFVDETGNLKKDYDLGDGVHLNALGYKKLANVVKDYLKYKSERIICMGDSLTFGFFLYHPLESYPDHLNKKGYSTVNKGINGDVTSNMLSRLSYAFENDEHYDRCVLMGGVNDLAMYYSVEKIFNCFKLMYELCKEHNTELTIISILPVRW